ncbi:hypothetical protein KIPB_013577, partial [Kipferlia bialata]
LTGMCNGQFKNALKLKQRYNAIRLEHDAIKADQDRQLAKSATSPKAAEKLAAIQVEFSTAHSIYTALQDDFNAYEAYARQHAARHVGGQVASMVRAMAEYYGQAYRVMSELTPKMQGCENAFMLETPEPAVPVLR